MQRVIRFLSWSAFDRGYFMEIARAFGLRYAIVVLLPRRWRNVKRDPTDTGDYGDIDAD